MVGLAPARVPVRDTVDVTVTPAAGAGSSRSIITRWYRASRIRLSAWRTLTDDAYKSLVIGSVSCLTIQSIPVSWVT